MASPDRTTMTIERMRFACWIKKGYRLTLWINNSYCFSTAKMVMRTHFDVILICTLPLCIFYCRSKILEICNIFKSFIRWLLLWFFASFYKLYLKNYLHFLRFTPQQKAVRATDKLSVFSLYYLRFLHTNLPLALTRNWRVQFNSLLVLLDLSKDTIHSAENLKLRSNETPPHFITLWIKITHDTVKYLPSRHLFIDFIKTCFNYPNYCHGITNSKEHIIKILPRN